ncbi:alpha/beta hydrolase [Novosphingobium sp.]|uniref:alpha/beta hydrolase n=1 Tax=Novosphingobium sp. TaxID=1874826 RepID=UPI00286E7FAE|nr:alpha/beta hydrolase [Novosphingobium sp.]
MKRTTAILIAALGTALLPAAMPVAVMAKPVAAASAETQVLRSDAKAYLEGLKKQPRPPMSDAMIAQMRKIPPQVIEKMMAASEVPLGTLAVDRKLTMPGPGGNMDLRLFDSRADRGPGPVVVFYHGGGFVVGSIGTHAALAAEMSRQLDLPVVSVEYRLAPEHKWPAAPDDAEAAARWIAANGAALGREVNGLVLTGDSAGGTLTLLTALALRDKPAAAPVKLMIPLYPMTDASRSYPSMVAFSGDYGLTKEDMAYFGKSYAANVKSPRHSSLLADLHGLPPTVLATAGFDPLRDGGRAFVAKLAQSGVPVSYYEAKGNIHGFATFRKGIPSAQDDLNAIMALSRAMLAGK